MSNPLIVSDIPIVDDMAILDDMSHCHPEYLLEQEFIRSFRTAFNNVVKELGRRKVFSAVDVIASIFQREELCSYFHQATKKSNPTTVPGTSTASYQQDTHLQPNILPMAVQTGTSSFNDETANSTVSQVDIGETLGNADINDEVRNDIPDVNQPLNDSFENVQSEAVTEESWRQAQNLQINAAVTQVNGVRHNLRTSLIQARQLLNHISAATKLTSDLVAKAKKPSEKLSFYESDAQVQIRNLKELKLRIKSCFRELENLDEVMIDVSRHTS